VRGCPADLGRYHLAALAQGEGTKALASAFQPVQDELQTAITARVEAEKAMTNPHRALSKNPQRVLTNSRDE